LFLFHFQWFFVFFLCIALHCETDQFETVVVVVVVFVLFFFVAQAGETWTSRFTHCNLEAGKRYEYRIIAVNRYGMSEPSAMRSFTTLSAGYREPPAPEQAPVCVNSTENSIEIKWFPPMAASQAVLTMFTVEASFGRNDSHRVWGVVFEGLDLSVNITSLAPGTVANFRVRSVSAGGSSFLTSPSVECHSLPKPADPPLPVVVSEYKSVHVQVFPKRKIFFLSSHLQLNGTREYCFVHIVLVFVHRQSVQHSLVRQGMELPC
jgi:hypothetical protein